MPRTRDFHCPSCTPSASAGLGSEFTPHAIGLPNIRPPGRSKFPVRMLTTSTSHDVSVPNSWLHVPMRPYSAARAAAAGRHRGPLAGAELLVLQSLYRCRPPWTLRLGVV